MKYAIISATFIMMVMCAMLRCMEEESCPLLEKCKKKQIALSEKFQELPLEMRDTIFYFLPGNHPFVNEHYRRYVPSDVVVQKITAAHQEYIRDEMRKIQQEYEYTQGKPTYLKSRKNLVENIGKFMRTTRYDPDTSGRIPCNKFSLFWEPLRELVDYISVKNLSRTNKNEIKIRLQHYSIMADKQINAYADIVDQRDCKNMHRAILGHYKQCVKDYKIYSYVACEDCCKHSKNLLTVFGCCFVVGGIVFTAAHAWQGGSPLVPLSSYGGALATFIVRCILARHITDVKENAITSVTKKEMIMRHLKRMKNSINLSIPSKEDV